MFQENIVKRTNIGKARDPRRNQTDAEKKLWAMLRDRSFANVKFRRQFPIENYILDFYSPDLKLCVEADGDSIILKKATGKMRKGQKFSLNLEYKY